MADRRLPTLVRIGHITAQQLDTATPDPPSLPSIASTLIGAHLLILMRSTVIIEDELFKKAKRRAAECGTTLSDLVNQALRESLRSADEKVHQPYRRWLTDVVNGREPFALSVLVAVGFVRVVTNAEIHPLPTPLPTALAVIDHLVAHPRCRVVAPSSQHWGQVADLCRLAGVDGKLVADAHHAAIAIAEGCTWVTRDPDFGAFAPHGLRWQHLVLS